MNIRNLYNVQERAAEEAFETLVTTSQLRLERIVSVGQSTPDGEWLSQDQSEWVVLLSGAAALRFEDEEVALELHPGDYLLIPGRKRHRVEWTAAHPPTVWLALHWTNDGEEPSR